jgi:drug/metabolite transporter (DMT)-like permease
MGDYAGGRATRLEASASVTATAQAAGMLVLIPAVLLVDGHLTWRAVIAGVLGGISGEIGLLLLYSALSRAAMAVVSPITAVLTAVIPVLAGAILGEPLTPQQWGGAGLAFGAIMLISQGGTTDGLGPAHHARPTLGVVGLCLAAGTGFGLFVVALDRAGEGVGLWPLVAARPVGTLLATSYALMTHVRPMVRKASLPLASAAGVLDVTANAFAALAAQRGKVAIAGVLIALYPASTVALARTLDKEPMTRTQLVGFATAVVAVLLIAL